MLDSKSLYSPEFISIITTYKCTAACKECCFECSTWAKDRLSFAQVCKIIDDAVDMKSVKFVVWTGGECTLLGDTLFEGIKYAKSKGLPSRIVSNGWWAKDFKSAKKMLNKMIDNGLVELNISTGDNHQEFISEDTAILAATCGARLGIASVLSIEKHSESSFTPKKLKENRIYKQFIQDDENVNMFSVINPIWISLHKDTSYSYSSQEINHPDLKKGCDNIFTFLGVDPNGNQIGCCGLTMRYIPEMNLGNIYDTPLSVGYYKQFNDFLKRWIFVSGPLKILEQVKEWEPGIHIPKFAHSCAYCAYLYNNEDVKSTIIKNYSLVQESIDTEFKSKLEFYNFKQNRCVK
ncbi:radical SAM protein [Enterococcus gilvus]|uniref:radical SAM protein n=1 Tax=Enterococcus gilvus TaxID=160453 RepID=UPI003ED909FE